MKLSTKEIAITSLFIAIVAVMTLVPYLGMIPLVIISVNIVLVPIIVCSQTTNVKTALIVSTAFGILSMINSYLHPTTLLAIAIQNPLVSVLPRIFIGPFTYWTYVGLKKKFDKNNKKNSDENIEANEIPSNFKKRYKKNISASSIATVVGVLTNSILFFTMLLICYGGMILANGHAVGLSLVGAIAVSNTIPEVIIATMICPVLVSALDKAMKME